MRDVTVDEIIKRNEPISEQNNKIAVQLLLYIYIGKNPSREVYNKLFISSSALRFSLFSLSLSFIAE